MARAIAHFKESVFIVNLIDIKDAASVVGGQGRKNCYMIWDFEVEPVTLGRRACAPCTKKFLLYCLETNSFIDSQGKEFEFGEEEDAIFFTSQNEAYDAVTALGGVWVNSERQIVPQF